MAHPYIPSTLKEAACFERITGVTEMQTNSMHHQSIKEPASRLAG